MLVDEEVPSLLNRATMKRLLYTIMCATLIGMLASPSLAYVLPATFIGRMMGERAMKSPMKQVSFAMKAEGSETPTLKVTLAKPGKVLLEALPAAPEQEPITAARIDIVDGRITPTGDFSKFPGTPELWSIFLLQVLDAKDGDEVEAQWNQLAEQLGLNALETSLTRCDSIVCFKLTPTAENTSAVLHTGRSLFRILNWKPTAQDPAAKAIEMRLHNYKESQAPHWVPQQLEFIDASGASLRFESLDVEFVPPVESKD